MDAGIGFSTRQTLKIAKYGASFEDHQILQDVQGRQTGEMPKTIPRAVLYTDG